MNENEILSLRDIDGNFYENAFIVEVNENRVGIRTQDGKCYCFNKNDIQVNTTEF